MLNARKPACRPFWALLTFIAGCLVSAALAWYQHGLNAQRVMDALQATALETSEKILERVRLYQYGLGGMHGAVQVAGEELRRELVVRYSRTRDFVSEFPGARGFGFIRRVPLAEEARFVASARADGWPEFSIRQLAPHDGERFVIQYVEPVGRNREAVGLDIASERNRREAALSALRSGEVRLTGPITLVQATGNPLQSFLILMPVYQGSATPQSVAERERRGIGWSYAPLLMAEVLADLRLDPARLHMKLVDVTHPGRPEVFHDSHGGTAHATDLPAWTLEREVYGRRWQFDFEAMPAFVAALNLPSPGWMLTSGCVVSLLLAALVAALVTVAQRRQELQAGQARLAAMVESSTDAIVGRSLDDTVTSWNPGAEQMFGYTAREALGRSFRQLVVPAAFVEESAQVLARAASGQAVPPFETRRKRQDGTWLDVSAGASPIRDSHGRVIGVSTTLRDVSAQKAAQAQILALNASLERQVEQRTEELSRLNLLLGNVLRSASEVAIIATDPRGLINLFNTGAERMLGHAAQDMVGRSHLTHFHLERELLARGEALSQAAGQRIEGFRVLTHLAESSGADIHEWTYVRRNGSYLTVSLAVTAMRDEKGRVGGYLGVAVDISERKAAERELAASLALTRAILDTAINPILTIDAYGQLRSINPAGERTFGYRLHEVIGRHVRLLLPEPLGEEFERLLQGDPSTAQVAGVRREAEALRKDGSRFPVQISLGAMRMDGQTMVVGILADVTEQHLQREALTAARDQLAMASEVAELGVWSWNLADDSLQWNDRMFALYRLPVSLRETGLRYEHWSAWVDAEDRVRAEALLQAAVEGHAVYDLVFRLRHADGSVLHIHAAARVERDAEGRALRVTGINHDITAHRELEQRLRQAKEQADAASAAKTSFLANMSHEIRTPMNAVLGMLQLIEQTELSDPQRDYLSKAHGAARSLLGLLNDILDYSKIEADKLQLDPHAFALDGLLRDLAAVLSGNLGQKQVELVYDLAADLPAVLEGDSLRLQQILINLAGNALKFTAQGQVVIQVAERARRDSLVTLRFSVSDTGIGISPEQLERIFEGFNQAEASTSRRFGGTGLGLGICRRLVALMGGTLEVRSSLGQGSCFWFDIDLPVVQARPPILDEAVDGRPCRLLLAEGRALTAQVLLRTLRVPGWKVDWVSASDQAIEQVRQAELQARPYDLVLLDWNLPGLDGLATASFIHLQAPQPLPVVILNSVPGCQALAEARRQACPPFCDVLTKPLTSLQLIESVGRLLAQSGTDASLAAPWLPKPPRLAGLRVLVVEDNLLNRQVAAELLAGEGASVQLAEGGLQGVQMVRQARPPFDLVIMDVQMPDIDGLEATRRIRADARFATLPILAMTANAAESDRNACLAAGMNQHIGKPIDLEKLVEALRTLSLWRPAAVPAGATPGPASLCEPAGSIMARFGGQRTLYESALRRFEHDAIALLDDLSGYAETGQPTAAEAALHALKGMAGTLGASTLAYRVGALEQALRTYEPQALDQVRDALPGLQRLLEDSRACLWAALPAEAGVAGMKVAAPPMTLAGALAALRPLLQSNNMKALDLLEALPPVSGEERARLDRLTTHVQALDFKAALTVLQELENA